MERLFVFINHGQLLYVQHGRRVDDTDKLGILCSVRLSDSFLTNFISGTTDQSFCWIFVLLKNYQTIGISFHLLHIYDNEN